jgi:hypothetical protein
MFRALICPSSGACDYIVELPHWPFRSSAVLKLAARIPPQPNRTLTPTHSNPRTKGQCGSSTIQSHTPEDGHINTRNMLNI